ncbi:MAG: hypothetical protein M3P93_14175 [Actinomycetota bacterium]|nr:hypothetical protein [Actinomycetota bacterium]
MAALAWVLGLVVQARHPVAASARDVVLRTLLRSRRVGAWTHRGGWRPSSAQRHGIEARRHRELAGQLLPQPTVATD